MRAYVLVISLIIISFATLARATPDENTPSSKPDSILSLSKDEISYINNKKELKMCVDPDWMPYEKITNHGTYIGMASDYHSILERLIGLKYTIVHTASWADSLKLAKEGKCDLVSMLNKNDDRSKYLDFSVPYLTSPTVFVTNDQASLVHDFRDLTGKSLALVKGYIHDEYVSVKFPKIERVYVGSVTEGLRLVSSGKVYASVGSLLEIPYNIRQQKLSNLKITGDAKLEYRLRVGIRKGDKLLLSIINKAISKISREQHDQLLNKWVSVSYEKNYNYLVIFQILGVSVLIMLVMAGKSYLTSKYNKQLLKLNRDLTDAKKELEDINLNLELKITDETNRRLDNERLLMQQSKLASMGDMIGAIAHQWRQPLNSIGLIIQEIEDAHATDTVDKELLQGDVKKAMGILLSMSDTINDFSNFYKPDKQKQSFKVCKNIHEVVNMLLPQMISCGICISVSCDDTDITGQLKQEELPFDCCTHISAEGYPNEFKHVILNLLKNSMDAFETLKGAKNISIRISHDDRFVTVDVEDNGGGIPADICSRVFEPYFTTKEEGKGVGIGLYMSKKILENMSGELQFCNSGSGAKFTLVMRRSISD